MLGFIELLSFICKDLLALTKYIFTKFLVKFISVFNNALFPLYVFVKVLLVTSVGEIDIELWSKETPKACRNFVQLCMEGYYNGTIFHRVVKDFIVQGGDPTGTGTDGESIYGAPFKVRS